jgi:N-acetylglucosaminyl-diphospho-decaprenol L-rhamnosyltransferase
VRSACASDGRPLRFGRSDDLYRDCCTEPEVVPRRATRATSAWTPRALVTAFRDVGAVLCAYKSDVSRVASAVVSLSAAGIPPDAIVVVDNSSDAVLGAAMSQHCVKYLPAQNRGLGAAFNLGVGAIPSEIGYVFFGNVDLVLRESTISELRSALDAEGCAWAADPRQDDASGNVVHARVALRPRRSRGAGPVFYAGVVMEEAAAVVPTAFPCAGAMLVRRSHLAELGGWDEGIFLEAEDVDLAYRAWRRGFCSLYVPTAVLTHEVGSSSELAGDADRLRRFASGLASSAYIAARHLGRCSAFAARLHALWLGARRAFGTQSLGPIVVALRPYSVLPPMPEAPVRPAADADAWRSWTRAFPPVHG